MCISIHLECNCPVSSLKIQVIGCKIYAEPQISEGSFLGENHLDIAAKFCPICKSKNEPDAIVCRRCGASLENYFTDKAGTTRSTELQAKVAENIAYLFPDEATIPNHGIAIYVEGKPDPVFLSSDKEFVIGRKIEETPQAFLDLAPMGGYHMGLSRRHVMIRRAEHGYEVIDLSSRNGTWVNGERLIPNKPYPLATGSLLRLARLRFFVLYRPVTEPRQQK